MVRKEEGERKRKCAQPDTCERSSRGRSDTLFEFQQDGKKRENLNEIAAPV